MVRGPCPVLSPFLGCFSVLQNMLRASWSSSGHTKCVFLLRDTLFILASASAGRLGVFHAMSFPGSFLERGWGVLCFRQGFCGEYSGPSLAPRFTGLNVPAQPMGDCYILCGRSGVTWSAWAAHRQRCEQFPFTAGCNLKELSKTTVSF